MREECDNKGNVFRRKIPRESSHPIEKGVENLFSKSTLENARGHKPAFIDVDSAHATTKRGKKECVPEKWTLNEDEKTNLCRWLCENGTANDFEHFRAIFDLLEEALDLIPPLSDDPSPQEG